MLGVILTIIVLVFIFGIRIVPQERRAIVESFGKYNRYLEPGFNFIIPIIEATKSRDIRAHTLDIPAQPVITKDNVEIQVDGIVWARPYATEEAIKKTYYNIDNWKKAIQQLAQTNLRQEFGSLTLDESLIARATISANLQKELDAITDEWGIKVDKVEIKEIDPPADIKTAMHLQKTAEQTRRAAKLEATGRFEAAEQDKLAAIEKADGFRQSEIKMAEGRAKAIELINVASEKFFKGNAVKLKELEVTQASLQHNAKIILTEKGIKPSIILGDIPVANVKG
ncbi:MAG: SPFH/Band 7/PHB domain protein [Candidatus Omnitrophica bacterium]|nr:SPFH/Band 7/PHB domain protein [Candidatus Omnitrophota bacterium]